MKGKRKREELYRKSYKETRQKQRGTEHARDLTEKLFSSYSKIMTKLIF
jgi:hypothetical protein